MNHLAPAIGASAVKQHLLAAMATPDTFGGSDHRPGGNTVLDAYIDFFGDAYGGMDADAASSGGFGAMKGAGSSSFGADGGLDFDDGYEHDPRTAHLLRIEEVLGYTEVDI